MKAIVKAFAVGVLGALAISYAAARVANPPNACDAGGEVSSRSCTFERLVWELVENSNDVEELKAYLVMYPAGRFVGEARHRLEGLIPREGKLTVRSITA